MMTVREVIALLEAGPPDAYVLIGGLPGPVENVLGFPESGAPHKVLIVSDLDRD